MTFRHDAGRTGLNPTESVLTPKNVSSTTFGLLRTLAVDGKVDAQPLYLSRFTVGGKSRNVVFVATEKDSVYAFDSDDGTALWHVSVTASGESPSDDQGCGQVTPTIGVTATPVIDRSAGTHGTLYVVAMSKDTAGKYHQRLHALDLTTGAELLNGPTEISATYPNDGGTTSFDPGQYEERSALLLANGTIYTTWTSHCDTSPYSGWVIAYSASTLQQTAVGNVGPNAGTTNAGNYKGPAIWMSGNGPAVDSAGAIYLMTANGAFDTTLDSSGFPARGDYGNSFVKMTTSGSKIAVTDYFALRNGVDESNQDQDLGSGGEMLLPDLTDSDGTVRHLLVGAGKDGNIYVVNRDSMGHFSSSRNDIWQEIDGAFTVGTASSSGGIYSTPAYFNSTLYYGDIHGTLKAYAVSHALINANPTSQTALQFGYPGATVAVSANGNTNGIVWAHENVSTGAVLHAYDAGNLATELYNNTQAANSRDKIGAGNKYITPVIADGKVFVATQSSVAVFGLLQ